jgi:RNA polymerase sigma factor FliA
MICAERRETGQPGNSSIDEDTLVREHLPLVGYAVAEMAARVPRHVSPDDLVSAGMLGLAQAARSFDPARGVTFSCFASGRIKGALLDELRDRDWASRSVRAKARQVADATERLNAMLKRNATTAEVAQAVGMTSGEVNAVHNDVHRGAVLSLDALPSGDAAEPIAGSTGDIDAGILDQERRAYLVAAVAELPERLRRVVVGYFLEDRRMAVLAEELGVTESRISQMRGEALLLLKEGINSQLDPDLVSPEPSARVAKRRASYFSAIAECRNERQPFAAEGGDALARLIAVPA